MQNLRCFILATLCLIALAACSTPAPVAVSTGIIAATRLPAEPAAAEPSRPPAVTATPPPTLTPTPTPLPEWPVSADDPMPLTKYPITADSAALLKPAAIWNAGAIQTIAYSADGKLLAAGSATGIDLYDPLTLIQPQHLTIQTLYVGGLAFSPDGSLLAAMEYSVPGQTLVEVFDVQSGKVLWSYGGGTFVTISGFSADSGTIVIQENRWTRAFKARDGSKGYELQFDQSLLSASGDQMVVVTSGKAQVVNPADGTVISKFAAPGCEQFSLSRTGGFLGATCDSGIRVWQTATGKLIAAVEGKRMTLSPDGKVLAASPGFIEHQRSIPLTLWHLNAAGAGYENPVRVGKDVLPAFTDWLPGSVSFTPDGQQLLMVYNDEKSQTEANKAFLLLIDTQTGKTNQQTNLLDCKGNTCFGLELQQVLVSPEGRSAAILFAPGMTHYDNAVTLRAYTYLNSLESGGYKEISSGGLVNPPTILFNPAGSALAYFNGSKIAIKDLASIQKNFLIPGPHFSGLASFSPDGKILCSMGNPPQCQATAGIKPYFPFTENLAAFSPDGKWAVWGDMPSIQVAANQPPYTPLVTLKELGKYLVSLAYSPDSSLLAASIDVKENDPQTTVIIWQTKDMKELARFQTQGWASSLKFSPDNRFLVGIDSVGHNTALPGGYWVPTVKVWQVSDGKEVRKLDENDISSFDLSPDGSLAVIGKGKWNWMDTRIKLIRVADGQVLKEWMTAAYSGAAVAFSPDGKLLAAQLGNGVILFWGVQIR